MNARRPRWQRALGLGGILAGALAGVAAQGETVDYGRPETWLCRPGRQDACSVDLTTTVLTASGERSVERWSADPDAPIDCFYVYPTVSKDETPVSDMDPGPEERRVVEQQFARWASHCRPFAPLYRQSTLAGLRASLTKDGPPREFETGYGDVRDAWRHYLEHDNRGRGVVLIGHSQGARMLTELIRREIDGQPVQQRIVSAILLGSNVYVPGDGDVGGTFPHLPLCRAADQTGCVLSYVSFRSELPPPAGARFGAPRGDEEVGCTNPAALGGGSGELHAYLPTDGVRSPQPPRWLESGEPIETPFVSVPGLLSARCAVRDGYSFLEVSVHGDPTDPRLDDIPGDVLDPEGRVVRAWGLHLVDVHLAMGDLLAIVARQSAAYEGRQ